jgi:hypothetical protein
LVLLAVTDHMTKLLLAVTDHMAKLLLAVTLSLDSERP